MWLALAAGCGLGTSGLEAVDGGGAIVGEAGGDGPSTGDATMDAPGGDGSSGSSGGGNGSSGSDGSSGSSSGASDAQQDVALSDVLVDGCKPKGPENCTNGTDDDCNGLVDCQDPACTSAGYACVPDPSAAGGGWSFSPLDANGQPGCPAPLMAANVTVDPTDLTSPATCTCTCNPGPLPSCVSGNINATYGNGNCNMGFTQSANNGNCTMAGLTVEAYVAASTNPTGGGCTGAVTKTVPPTGGTQGQLCTGEKMFGAGCGSGQVCALVPTGFTACVEHGSPATCPAMGYTTPNTVGTIADTRGCTACMCGGFTSESCTGAWSFYANNNCTGTADLTLVADGTCRATGSNGTGYGSNRYTATASATCGAPTTQPQPNGMVTLNGAQIVCCQ